MTDASLVDHAMPFAPRVIDADAREELPPSLSPAPQVIATDRAEPVVPAERAPVATQREPVRRRDRVVTFGIAGVAACVAGWAAVDAVGWVSTAFERNGALGFLALTALIAGLAGAGAVIARELGSLLRLKSVEAARKYFSDPALTPAQTRAAVADVLAVVPRDRETEKAIEAFQRQVQVHHGSSQQLELLSRTVIKPLDGRAETHVRTAVLRAFGITAISPTALTDAAFFLACGVRMVRGIAGAYGHRPTLAATIHILRRLVFEAGKLGAVDLASASLVQHLGGAVTERFATMTADALYAAYRMARLGVIVMDLCRPVAFAPDDAPSVGSLVSGIMRRPAAPPAPASLQSL